MSHVLSYNIRMHIVNKEYAAVVCACILIVNGSRASGVCTLLFTEAYGLPEDNRNFTRR